MSNTPIRLNGRSYDFSSIRPSGLPPGLDDSLFLAFLRGVNFSDQVTPSAPGGVHGIPLPRGRGTYGANGGLEVVFEAWDEFTKNCRRNNITGITDFDFDLNLDVIAKGRQTKIQLMESSFLGISGGWQRGGTDGLIVTIPIYVRYLLINGVCSYSLDLDQNLGADPTTGFDIGL